MFWGGAYSDKEISRKLRFIQSMHGFDDTDVGVGPIFVYFARLIRHAANNIQIRTMNKT
jgi:hypothetical protein